MSEDLRDKVTAFVLTVGEPTTLECIVALERQTHRVKIERIENVAPMDRALQAMLDRCTTPYFIQVDADMVLYQDAVQRLYRTIESQPPSVYQALISLHDEHLGRDILGVRIVRHEIAKKYPFRAVQGCETDQFRRAEADGYHTVARIGKDIGVAGVHKATQSPQACYERYRTLFRRARKSEGIDWVRPYAAEFLQRLIRDPNEANLYVLLGAVAGMLAPLEVDEGEKNALVIPAELVRLHNHFQGVFSCPKE
jgi:hypothetical protein